MAKHVVWFTDPDGGIVGDEEVEVVHGEDLCTECRLCVCPQCYAPCRESGDLEHIVERPAPYTWYC